MICAKISKEGHILNVTSNKCNMAEKPAHRITCNYGDCGGTYFWKPAKWSKVRLILSNYFTPKLSLIIYYSSASQVVVSATKSALFHASTGSETFKKTSVYVAKIRCQWLVNSALPIVIKPFLIIESKLEINSSRSIKKVTWHRVRSWEVYSVWQKTAIMIWEYRTKLSR